VAEPVLPGRRLEVAETGGASVVEDDVEEGTVDAQAAIVVDEAQLSELIAPRHAVPDWRAAPLGLSLVWLWSLEYRRGVGDCLRRALVAINQWLRQERNARKFPALWQTITRKIRGHLNYLGVTDNSRALKQFKWAVRRLLCKWLYRWGQRRSFTWVSFLRYTARHPLPRTKRLVSLNPVWRTTV
jgi:Group II intron, maturase-specific domain